MHIDRRSFLAGAPALEPGSAKAVAMCDVDPDQLNAAAGDRPTRYRDYRELLAKERPDIALVATPHVCVEKPGCHTLGEGRAMVRAARAADRVVQVDFASPGLLAQSQRHRISGAAPGPSGRNGRARCIPPAAAASSATIPTHPTPLWRGGPVVARRRTF